MTTNVSAFTVAEHTNNGQHNDDQTKVFAVGDSTVITVLADGVSESTSGRIASMFMCHYISEYLDQNYKPDDNAIDHPTIFKAAIESGITKLTEFASEILRLHKESRHRQNEREAKFQSVIDKTNEDGKMILDGEPPYEAKFWEHIGNMRSSTPACDPYDNELSRYILGVVGGILTALKAEDIDKTKEGIKDKIIKALKDGNPLSFKTTQSIAVIRKIADDRCELHTATVGDPEILLVKFDEGNSVDDILVHFRSGRGESLLT